MSRTAGLDYLDYHNIYNIKQSLTGEEIFNISNVISDVLKGKEKIDLIVVPSENLEEVFIYSLLESIAEANNVYINIINPFDIYRINNIMCSDTLVLVGLDEKKLDDFLSYTSSFINIYCIGKHECTMIKADDKINIHKSYYGNAKMSKKGVTKEELMEDIVNHIHDVQYVCTLFMKLLYNQILMHDYTKLEFFDEFYHDYVTAQESEFIDFKDENWYKNIHKVERHHLNNSVPDDVNLLDVVEMVIDCVCAGLSRSGEIYPIKIPQDVLERAIENTKNFLIDYIRVIDTDGEYKNLISDRTTKRSY